MLDHDWIGKQGSVITNPLGDMALGYARNPSALLPS